MTTVPKIFGKGMHIWLGLILLVLLILQFSTGYSMLINHAVEPVVRKLHIFIGIAISGIGVVHAYFGIGLWFFKFKYARKESA